MQHHLYKWGATQSPPPATTPTESEWLVFQALQVTKMHGPVWESQVWSNPLVYRDQGTFQGCAVSSHRAGPNFPNAQFNHLSETNANKLVVIHTSDIHLNWTKGDKKEQVEGRGGRKMTVQ